MSVMLSASIQQFQRDVIAILRRLTQLSDEWKVIRDECFINI